jgi:hypothetical protein
MLLSEWYKREGRGSLTRLHRRTGVSYSTIHEALRGVPISRHPIAKALSEGTDGAVGVDDLTSPPNPAEPSWKRKRSQEEPTRQPDGPSPVRADAETLPPTPHGVAS